MCMFQAQSFIEAELADDCKSEDGSGINVDEKAEGGYGGNTAEEQHEQFMLFSRIVHEYIADGAPNEIIIRCLH